MASSWMTSCWRLETLFAEMLSRDLDLEGVLFSFSIDETLLKDLSCELVTLLKELSLSVDSRYWAPVFKKESSFEESSIF